MVEDTESTNKTKDRKTYMSNWQKLNRLKVNRNMTNYRQRQKEMIEAMKERIQELEHDNANLRDIIEDIQQKS